MISKLNERNNTVSDSLSRKKIIIPDIYSKSK
jgi:hypothetical protein